MAKGKEMRIAKSLFIEQNKAIKEISKLINVSERTISSWIKKHGWKQIKEAKAMSHHKDVENIKAAISAIAQSRIEIEVELKSARKSKDRIEETRLMTITRQQSDEVAKLNKALERMDKENKVTLSKYLDVMDNVFKAMQSQYPKLYIQTLDFQEGHINEIAIKLG